MAARLMKRKNKLKATAVKIGSTIGRVDGAAHKAADRATTAAKVAKKELVGLSKHLSKSSQRVKVALKG
jgi:hypothetical protein